MLRISKLLVIGALLVQGLAYAQVKEATVDGVGSGASRGEAVSNALANAAAQAFGVRIDATSISGTTAVDISAKEESQVIVSSLNTHVATKVKSPGNRPILGYTVTSAAQRASGLWDAEVLMRYAQFEQVGRKPDRRSVIVVTPDRRHAEVVVDAVESALVESRRFDVLDRDNARLYDQERLFVQGSDAAPAEVARLGNASGADYLLIAELRDLNIANDRRETIRLTGEVLVSSSLSGVLKLQMVEFSSRKVKWSGTQRFGQTYEGVSAIGTQTLTKHASRSADKLIAGMLDTIYPIRIVKVVGNLAVINRGEGSVTPGQKYQIYLVGEELIDPQSGESLGAMEVDVGSGVISDVKPKFAYLKVDKGALDGNGSYLVRRMP